MKDRAVPIVGSVRISGLDALPSSKVTGAWNHAGLHGK